MVVELRQMTDDLSGLFIKIYHEPGGYLQKNYLCAQIQRCEKTFYYEALRSSHVAIQGTAVFARWFLKVGPGCFVIKKVWKIFLER